MAPDDPGWAVPALTAVTVTCDAELDRWSFVATADAWTGNGQVLLSADGAYLERHDIYTAGAAGDGSADTLELELTAVADWRDVSPGSTTAFGCDAPDLAGVLRIYERASKTVADCRAFGESPERWATWEPETACTTVLDTGDTGDTGR